MSPSRQTGFVSVFRWKGDVAAGSLPRDRRPPVVAGHLVPTIAESQVSFVRGMSKPIPQATVIALTIEERKALEALAAHSGDLERSFRSIMNTDSGDHEHAHEPA